MFFESLPVQGVNITETGVSITEISTVELNNKFKSVIMEIKVNNKKEENKQFNGQINYYTLKCSRLVTLTFIDGKCNSVVKGENGLLLKSAAPGDNCDFNCLYTCLNDFISHL